MTAEALTCPYCNATQPARPGVAVGQRLPCVRCGETFAVTHLPEAVQTEPPAWGTAAGPRPAHPATPGEVARRGPRPRNNRAVAAAVLGVMLLAGGIGLAYALRTQDFRRKNDTSLPRKSRRPAGDEPPAAGPTPPARLAGLGYLPPSTNVVAGAAVADLLARDGARALIARPLKFGKSELRLSQLAEWTGLRVEEIDHVVLGATLLAGEVDWTPPVTVVVRTARDYDAEAMRQALKATKPVTVPSADGVKRTLYSAKLADLPATLWQVDGRTAVLGLADLDLDKVPGQPHEGAGRLPAEVRDALENRLSGAPPLWVAGHSADWSKTWLPTLLKGLKGVPLTDQLPRTRTLVLSLTVEPAGRLLWQVRAADDEAAAALEKALASRLKANPSAFKPARDGAWISVQMDVDLGAAGGKRPR